MNNVSTISMKTEDQRINSELKTEDQKIISEDKEEEGKLIPLIFNFQINFQIIFNDIYYLKVFQRT